MKRAMTSCECRQPCIATHFYPELLRETKSRLEAGLEVVVPVVALLLQLLHVRLKNLLHALVVLEPWLEMSCLMCNLFYYFNVTACSYVSFELDSKSS